MRRTDYLPSVFSILAGGLRTEQYDTMARQRASTDADEPRSAVPFDATESLALGRTGIKVTRLGFGSASIGGLYTAVSDADAMATVERAWDLGVRLFDTAPLYGYGVAERRLGAVLADRPRDAFTVSTKVGRLVRRIDLIGPTADVDPQAIDGREDAFYPRSEPVRMVFDYSADGVRRSLDESLARLGLDRIDIALIHDPDSHWEVAIDDAFPALARLREDGVVGAIGVGMNQAAMLARFARDGDFDVFLMASRYTLLDQTALDELLPLCRQRGIAILCAGVMNTGLLAGPRPGARFDYGTAPPALVERARRLGTVCARHDVSLRDAAIQFPLAHPAIVSLVAGVRTVAHLDEYPAAMARSIPGALWDELRAEGLIRPDAPVPDGEAAGGGA
jgi:D-threo-aldose 1-dehydrogenase